MTLKRTSEKEPLYEVAFVSEGERTTTTPYGEMTRSEIGKEFQTIRIPELDIGEEEKIGYGVQIDPYRSEYVLIKRVANLERKAETKKDILRVVESDVEDGIDEALRDDPEGEIRSLMTVDLIGNYINDTDRSGILDKTELWKAARELSKKLRGEYSGEKLKKLREKYKGAKESSLKQAQEEEEGRFTVMWRTLNDYVGESRFKNREEALDYAMELVGGRDPTTQDEIKAVYFEVDGEDLYGNLMDYDDYELRRLSADGSQGIDDLDSFLGNADEKDGVAYTYLHYADINKIYDKLKDHEDTTLVSLLKEFVDTANKYKKEIQQGYDRVIEEDVGPDDYTPGEVMEAYFNLFEYCDEHSDELWKRKEAADPTGLSDEELIEIAEQYGAEYNDALAVLKSTVDRGHELDGSIEYTIAEMRARELSIERKKLVEVYNRYILKARREAMRKTADLIKEILEETNRGRIEELVFELNGKEVIDTEGEVWTVSGIDSAIDAKVTLSRPGETREGVDVADLQREAMKKTALKVDQSKLPEEAIAKLKDGMIPALTVAGGELKDFGGPEAALVYRVWAHPEKIGEEGDDFFFEFATKEEADDWRGSESAAEEKTLAVVWDGKDFREVLASLQKQAQEELSEEELVKAFDFLDGLRESGVTNMFGAGAYVMEQFGWDGRTAGKALALWMKTFGDGTATSQERAKKALGEKESSLKIAQEDIKKGDVVEGNLFEVGEVVAVGPASDLLDYDFSGAVSNSFDEEGGMRPDTPSVAVYFSDDRDTAVYPLDEVWKIKSPPESEEKESSLKAREAQIFEHVKEFDATGGVWNLNKDKGTLVRKDDIDIKKAVQDKGVWKYRIGDTPYLTAESGTYTVKVLGLEKNGKYLIKDETMDKEWIVDGDQLWSAPKEGIF